MKDSALVQDLDKYTIKDTGHVYVVEDKEKGIVKIGKSANPKQRIRNIKRAACAQGREYISHKVLSMSSFENKAHKALAEHHIANEWFKVSFKKAVEVVNSLLPKEVTAEQIEFLKQKEKERVKETGVMITEMVVSASERMKDALGGKEIRRVNVEALLSPRKFSGVERLSEIFDKGGNPTSQEWEDGYSDALGEWNRLSGEILAFLSALEVLNINDFADVWRAYKLNLTKAKLKEHEENQIR